MQVKVTLDLVYRDTDFYSQNELDEMAESGYPLTLIDFKNFLREYFYDEPSELITELIIDEVKE